MRKIWVVVANSSESKIYRAENVNTLVEHHCLSHQESHMKAAELTSDRQGRGTQRMGYGTDTNEEKTSIKEKETTHFAREVNDYLTKSYQAGECDHLYLIAKPPFLGALHQALSKQLQSIIKGEVQKDLTHLSPQEIREYLPLTL